MNDKGEGFVFSPLLGWIIAIFVLVLVVALFFLLNDKGQGAIDFIKNLLRLK